MAFSAVAPSRGMSCVRPAGPASRQPALCHFILPSTPVQLGSSHLRIAAGHEVLHSTVTRAAAASKGFGKARPVAKPPTDVQPIIDPCPCQSGKNYKNCCQKVHEDPALATTPEAALRARFTAYVRNVPQYIIDSTHPDYYQYEYNKPGSDPEVAAKYKAAVEEGCTRFVYTHFKVVRTEPGTIPDEGFVAFSYKCAKAPPGAQPVADDGWSMTDERCRFLRADGQWRMADSQEFTRNLGQLLQNVEAQQQASKPAASEGAAA